jgi:hypothetical protein
MIAISRPGERMVYLTNNNKLLAEYNGHWVTLPIKLLGVPAGFGNPAPCMSPAAIRLYHQRRK